MIGVGCWIWAVMTAMFAACNSVYAALPICAVNGLGLVSVGPGRFPSLHACMYHAYAIFHGPAGMPGQSGLSPPCCQSAIGIESNRECNAHLGPLPAPPLLLQALVIPNVQSLTADYYASTSRGRAFGFLWVTISSGGMLGTLFATNIGEAGAGGRGDWGWGRRLDPMWSFSEMGVEQTASEICSQPCSLSFPCLSISLLASKGTAGE